MARLVALALAAAAADTQAAPAQWSPANKLFGHAVKNGPLPCGAEVTAFEHSCSAPPCTVTQLHVPSIYPGSSNPWDWENGRLRLYIDNETEASVDVLLRELAHVGAAGAVGNDPPADGSPFGNQLFGKTARTGGVYSTVRVPFGTSLRVTIQAAPSCAPGSASIYWLIVRGLEALPLTLGAGELALPDQARLALFRTANVTLQPQEFLTLVNVSTSYAGALVSTLYEAASGDPNYLEGCFRAFPDDPAAAGPPLYLSSGTEDFFLSASYFDEQMFKTPESGLTYYTGGGASLAAFKVFADRDLVLWSTGFALTMRNNEDSCPSGWPAAAGGADAEDLAARQARRAAQRGKSGPLRTGPATFSTLTWAYLWPADAAQLTFRGVPGPARGA